MGKKQKIVVFDFDGTLTTRDTLLLFIRHACGRRAFLRGFLLHLPLLVLMKLRLYDNGKCKERVFSHFFRGWTEEHFNESCQHFADSYQHILRPQTVQALRRAQQDGVRVFIVTASIDRWVQPFFPEVEVLGTQISVSCEPTDTSPQLTGRFLTPNCYGPEKVRRLRQVLPLEGSQREHYHITAYGDSRGDRELLAWADEGILVKENEITQYRNTAITAS